MARKRKAGTTTQTVEFNYIKSHAFRVVRADGVIGGLTPQGAIHISIFSERGAIPTRTFHFVDSAGRLGDEDASRRESCSGIVREVEVGVVLELPTAISFHKWLGGKIEELQSAVAASQSKPTGSA